MVKQITGTWKWTTNGILWLHFKGPSWSCCCFNPPCAEGMQCASKMCNYCWSMWAKSMKGQRASVGVITAFHLPGIFLSLFLGLSVCCYLFLHSENDFTFLPLSSILIVHTRCLYSKFFSVPQKSVSESSCKNILEYKEGMIASLTEEHTPSEQQGIKDQLVAHKDSRGCNHLW